MLQTSWMKKGSYHTVLSFTFGTCTALNSILKTSHKVLGARDSLVQISAHYDICVYIIYNHVIIIAYIARLVHGNFNQWLFNSMFMWNISSNSVVYHS